MICPKCKTKAKWKDKYCETCGAKLQLALPKLEKKTKQILMVVFGVLILITGIYWIGDYFTSPSIIAKRYFEKIIHNDISGIYKEIHMKDSTFVSETILQEKMDTFESVDTYRVISSKTDGREATVIIEYYLDNDPKAYQVYVSLYRNYGKKWIIYPNWKIDSAILAENVVFEVPTGSKITVDDVALDAFQNLEKSDDAYTIYQIPKMIAGVYQVKVTLPIGTEINKKVKIEDSKRFTVGDLELSLENRATIETAALQTLQTLYDGATQNQAFDTMQENLPAIKSPAQIGKRYRTLKSSLQNQSVTFTNVRIASVEVIDAYYSQNGKFTTTIEMIHHDTYTYEKNGEVITNEKTDRTSKVTMIWDETLQILDLEWK